SVNFVVLEMDEEELVPIILGRPFLATACVIIDIYEGKLSLRVENETVTFNIGKSMRSRRNSKKQPSQSSSVKNARLSSKGACPKKRKTMGVSYYHVLSDL
nr:hypothetical protein [Tanacetum cinerariifolium]